MDRLIATVTGLDNNDCERQVAELNYDNETTYSTYDKWSHDVRGRLHHP